MIAFGLSACALLSTATGCSDNDGKASPDPQTTAAGASGTDATFSSGAKAGSTSDTNSGGTTPGGAAGATGSTAGNGGSERSGGAGLGGTTGFGGGGGSDAAGLGGASQAGAGSSNLADGSLCIAKQGRCLAAATSGQVYKCNDAPHTTSEQNTSVVIAEDATQVAVGGNTCELVQASKEWHFSALEDGTYQISTLDGSHCLAAPKQGAQYSCFDTMRNVFGQQPASVIPCADKDIAVGGSACTKPLATTTWRITSVSGEYRISTPDGQMCLVTPSMKAPYECFSEPRTISGQTVASVVPCERTTVAIGGASCSEPTAVLTWTIQ